MNKRPLMQHVISEMDMGWVHLWAALGWVAFSSTCDGLGWVE